MRRADGGARSQGFKIIAWPLLGFPRRSSGGCVGVRGGRHPVDVGAGEESSINQAKEIFDINVFGLMRMTNAVLPHMRAQGRGRVVNVSSVLGLIPAPFMAIYAATKHAVEGLSLIHI